MHRCDRVVVLDRGKIVEVGTCAELLSDPVSMLTSMMGEESDSPHASSQAVEDIEVAVENTTTPKASETEKEVCYVTLPVLHFTLCCSILLYFSCFLHFSQKVKEVEGKTATKDGVLETKEERKAGKVMLSVYSRWFVL